MPPSALMPSATMPRAAVRVAGGALAAPAARAATATARPARRRPRPDAAPASTTTPTISWPSVIGAVRPLTGCGRTGTVIGPSRTSSTSVPQIAAASIRSSTSVSPGVGHGHLVEADVAAGVPADGPHAGVPADLGVERQRVLDELVGDPPVDGVERHVRPAEARRRRRSPGGPPAASGTGSRCRCAGSASRGSAGGGRTGPAPPSGRRRDSAGRPRRSPSAGRPASRRGSRGRAPRCRYGTAQPAADVEPPAGRREDRRVLAARPGPSRP